MRNWHRLFYYSLTLLTAACASIGSPDGGIYDEIPPRVVSSSPNDKATSHKRKKVEIRFNEYIKLENANEKVIVSPPQIEPAQVRAAGKKVKIELYDSLKENTTYTIDFSDAIVDNNEGNPMGNYTFSFSTGETIDTMEVSGTVLNAENLEPVKGMLVGLYPVDEAFNDTLLTTTPFCRVSRTNGSGHFVIKGVKNGRYRAYALNDKDGNYVFSQKSEMIAFDTTTFQTSSKWDVKMDTMWRDTTHFDSIRVTPYIRYMPDDLVLMAFLEEGQDHHLLKTERKEPEQFTLFFTAPADSAPVIRGLNFDEGCLAMDASEHFDTITYWITDTTYYRQQDTLRFELSYLDTDTLGLLQPRTDTLEIVPKLTWAKKWKEQKKLIDDWEKDRAKRKKRSKEPLPYEPNPYEKTWLDISCKPSGTLDPNQNPCFTSKEPLQKVDTTKIHFYIKQDSNWIQHPYLFLPQEKKSNAYTLYAEWDSKEVYRFEADTAAFISKMGHENKGMKLEFKVKKDEEYASFFVHTILPDTGVVVELLNRSDKVTKSLRTNDKGYADFFYLKPGEYYMRCFIDANGNGKWDTGNFRKGIQPEEVFYFPKPMSLKANWDIEQDWDVRNILRTKQKPVEITKQKADKKKTVSMKNLMREQMKKK